MSRSSRTLCRGRTAEPAEALQRPGKFPAAWRLLTAVNNNYIGLFYIAAAFLFFLLAGMLALLMRVQLAAPQEFLLAQETYNQLFTMHGTVMMFLFAVPVVEAIGVLLLPQMLAARDLPFPRLSAYRLLGLSRRRPGLLRLAVLRPRARRRLVHVSAADQHRLFARRSTPISGCSASASSRSPPSPARSRSSSACCAPARRA